jgi:hypothetical protein
MIKAFFYITIYTIAVVFAAASGMSARGATHTFHTTLTRIDYNAADHKLEIAIQMFTHDIAGILETSSHKRFDFDKSGEVDTALFDYVARNFIVTDQNRELKKLTWVGKEPDADTLWIYLEANSPTGPEGWTLQNSLFFEQFQEQTNLVVARFGNKKADLLFKVGDTARPIEAGGDK